jgi:cytochrome c553
MSKRMKLFGAAVASAAVILTIPGSLLAQSDGRSDVEIWAQTCSSCHNNQPRSKYDSVKWESIMMHMQLVARLPDSDAQAVLRYLKRGARSQEQAAASDTQSASAVDPAATEGASPKKPAASKSEPHGR